MSSTVVKSAHGTRSGNIRLRALVLAALLTPVNQLWIMQAETINRPVFATLFTLFFNVTFTLFILILGPLAIEIYEAFNSI